MTPRPRPGAPAGVYVHVPFCDKICPYCDFAVTATRKIPHLDYAQALITELHARRSALEARTLQSVYFGGGTPSRWEIDAMAQVLAAIIEQDVDKGQHLRELTFEANPLDITPESLEAWSQAGLTRVSLGVQSFQPRVLAALGRNHDATQARAAVDAILSHGELALSIDLIFGVPDQTPQEWGADLEVVRALAGDGLNHISCYNLTLEPNTPFARQAARGQLQVVDEEGCAHLLEQLIAALAELGLRQYEVSSFARPGYEAIHNSSYWLGAEYLGLGVGAHSLALEPQGVERRANTRQLAAYLRDPIGAQAQIERLSPADHFLERLYVNLRTTLGLDWPVLCAQFEGSLSQAAFDDAHALLMHFIEQGLLARDKTGERFAPTPRGLMVADVMAERLFALSL